MKDTNSVHVNTDNEPDHVPDTGKKVEPTDYVHKDKIKKVLKELHGGGNARRLLTRLLDE